MRAVFVFGLACLALVAAGPVTTEHKFADKVFLEHQKMLLELYSHYIQPSYFEDVQKFASEFKFDEFKTQFTKPEFFDHFMEFYHRGLYPRGEIFSIQNEHHRDEAQALFYMFYFAKDFETFYKFACWARQYVNEQMFIYTLTVAIFHRPDTQGMYVPPPYEFNPHLFFNHEVFFKLDYLKQKHAELDAEKMHEYEIRKFAENDFYIYANYSGWYIKYNEEQKMTYFTEDVGLNSYNYYFHADYPFWMDGELFGIDKDRRGELEYFFYQQLMARYYLERLSNDLGEIPEFSWYTPIKTGFYPGVRRYNGLDFPMRPNYYYLTTEEHTEALTEVTDYERRIRNIIELGYIVMPDGSYMYLKDKNFFNDFANIVFQNSDSPNYEFYKNFLWVARHLLGASFDVVDKYYAAPSAMETFETAFRDPMFWQLYWRVVKYFNDFKEAFYKPYSSEELKFPGVNIKDVEVDKLVTFFDHFDVSLYNGLYWNKENWQKHQYDFWVRQLRLNHHPFNVKIHVDSDKTTESVVRIFLGPKYDSYGHEYTLEESRLFWFELDVFKYTLKSGENVIVRNSEEFYRSSDDFTSSNVMFEKVELALQGKEQLSLNESQIHWGFPERLLLPKGKKGGMTYQMFFVVSPYHAPEKQYGQGFEEHYQSGVGTGARYYSTLPLGFPFDREIYEEHYFRFPNMYFEDVTIFHKSQFELNKPYWYENKEF